MLKEAISATSDKLETLKEAQKQAKAQLESGDLGRINMMPFREK